MEPFSSFGNQWCTTFPPLSLANGVCLLFVGCHVYFRHANHHHQRHLILVLVLIVSFLFFNPSFLSFFLFSFLPFHHRLLDTMAEQPSSLQKVRTSAAGS